jgi:peptidoglycan/xylan/chitin deacetylase (PgdA/CDA1 family)
MHKLDFLFFKVVVIRGLIVNIIFLFMLSACHEGYFKPPIDRKLIALTFDDGPNPLYTPNVLKILEENDVKATFFLIGRQAQAYPEIVKQIQNNGHEIGNHSQNHLFRLAILTPQEIENEICTAQETIFKITGEYPAFFRPPFGCSSEKLVFSCQRLSLPLINGSVKAYDTTMPGKDYIVSTILNATNPGSIIILHDGGGFSLFKNRSQTLGALPEIIHTLKERGYTFVTVKDLYDYHIRFVQSSANKAALY